MANLAELSSGRDNHFNLIRLLAAAAVLVSHSFPLAGGEQAGEPLRSNLGMTLGEVAVVTFFCISGFFISMSQDRSRGTVDFFAARALRIFPGLTLVVLVCAFVIGPAFTQLGTAQYLSDPQTYRYVLHNIALRTEFQLPGLFQNNPFPGINGSLWTLFYEALLYVLVGVSGVLALFRDNRRFLGLLVIYLTAYIAFQWLQERSDTLAAMGQLDALFKWSLPFVLGMAGYRYRERLHLRGWYAVPLLAIAALCLNRTGFYEAFVLLWTYLVFLAGFSARRLPFKLPGDYSYGLYIWAFPIQEILAHLLPGISPWQMMALAMPLSLVAAALSWHGLEKPCMAMRGGWVERLEAGWPSRFAKSGERP